MGIFKSVKITELDGMIDDPFQVGIQIKTVPSCIKAHPGTGDLLQQYFRIAMHQGLFICILQSLCIERQVTAAETGHIGDTHVSAVFNDLLERRTDPHTHQADIVYGLFFISVEGSQKCFNIKAFAAVFRIGILQPDDSLGKGLFGTADILMRQIQQIGKFQFS